MNSNHEVRYAVHPDDFKLYDTSRIRKEFLVENLFQENMVNLVYSHFDRLIVGGLLPVEKLTLEPMSIQKTRYFLDRRELGIINLGGKGKVIADNEPYELNYLDALYLGRGKKHIEFQSVEKSNPAKFYINAALAHADKSTKVVLRSEAEIEKLGDSAHSNTRELHKYIVPARVETCQLLMGVTHCHENNVWNTMPCHTHELRMEAYLYFNFNTDEQVCHIMGQPQETRNIWVQNENVVLSPPWSIHTAAGTSNYSFIWGMAGSESDMDFIKKNHLK